MFSIQTYQNGSSRRNLQKVASSLSWMMPKERSSMKLRFQCLSSCSSSSLDQQTNLLNSNKSTLLCRNPSMFLLVDKKSFSCQRSQTRKMTKLKQKYGLTVKNSLKKGMIVNAKVRHAMSNSLLTRELSLSHIRLPTLVRVVIMVKHHRRRFFRFKQ